MVNGFVGTVWRTRRSWTWAAVVLGVVLIATPAWATFPGGGGGGAGGGGGGGSGGGGGGGGQVPEINLGAAGAALSFLIGATLIAWDRHRRAVSPAPLPASPV
jgi:hypothetical protein